MSRFERTALLIGNESLEKLSKAKVAVFGVGGVGGYVVESLARSGVGAFLLVDDDEVCESNINRQIIATTDTIGRAKVEVMKERILSINPDCRVEIRQCFFLPENADTFDFSEYSYVVDAVDTVTAKLAIIMKAKESHVPVISCMGAGNKLDPTKFQIADIYKTSVCPLAKVMRRELKKRGVKECKVLFSTEVALTPRTEENTVPQSKEAVTQTEVAVSQVEVAVSQAEVAMLQPDKAVTHTRRSTPGSISFVPSVAGLIIGGEVIKDLMKQ